MVSVVDIIQRFVMVSVVGFLMVSVVAGSAFLWFPSLVFLWFPSWQGHFFDGFRFSSSKRGPRRAEGGTFPARRNFATALGTRGRAVIVTSPCAAQRPRILT